MKRKNRFCGMLHTKNSIYCIEHIKLDSDNIDIINNRIPCPLDPNHTVFNYQLKSHLKKCNKNKLIHSNDDKIYYLKNCNSNTTNHSNTTQFDDKEIINKMLPILLNLSDPDLSTDIRENKFMSNNRIIELTSSNSKKHAIQQSSLIQHILSRITPLNNLTITEFGCGRAEFSRYIYESVKFSFPDTKQNFILLDRAPNRNKFDNKLSNNKNRIRIDIKDINLSPLVSNTESQYICVSKHLCGVATDFGLRSIINASSNTKSNHFPDLICFAMCCRHVCNSNDYVNKQYIINEVLKNQKNIDYDEFFFALTKLVSWATSGERNGENIQEQENDEVQEDDHFTSLPRNKRVKLGLKARYIIDMGRLRYLQDKLGDNYKVELFKYADKSITLENSVLIATKLK